MRGNGLSEDGLQVKVFEWSAVLILNDGNAFSAIVCIVDGNDVGMVTRNSKVVWPIAGIQLSAMLSHTIILI